MDSRSSLVVKVHIIKPYPSPTSSICPAPSSRLIINPVTVSVCVCIEEGSPGEEPSLCTWKEKPQMEGGHNAMVAGIQHLMSLCGLKPRDHSFPLTSLSIPITGQSVAGIALDKQPGLMYFQHTRS